MGPMEQTAQAVAQGAWQRQRHQGGLGRWHLMYGVHITYRGLEIEPGLGVIQCISDSSPGIPGFFVGIVVGPFDELSVGSVLAGLA